MVNACDDTNRGFNAFNYDTRATNAGFSHEVASGHPTTRKGNSISAIHGTTNIIGDHEDSLFNLYMCDFSITTGTFAKFFVTSVNLMNDINYIEGTVLVIATAYSSPRNIEIHDTS
jgi:hypothetical protein